MYTAPIQPVSFSGLRIDGTVSANNIKKLNELIKIFEKNGLIENLENNFNTDIVLNNQIDTVSVSHKQYGSLSKYNLSLPTEKLLSDISDLTKNIRTAIKKAAKDYTKSKNTYEVSRRGC